jgi:xanthine dehydrogenase YagS FAD-binding subunit
MKRFTYSAPTTTAEALSLLDGNARPLAGGTDLIPLMSEGQRAPERIVSLNRLDLRGITSLTDGLALGALVTLSELEREPQLRAWPYRALAEAARSAASPQLRNVATIGGNLLQEPRCWYYRGGFTCWLKGGALCDARGGEHHAHTLFQHSPCAAPHPSDPATALLALDALVRIATPNGERVVALLELLAPPTEDRRSLATLGADELILGVRLPARDGWRSTYQKAMPRAAFAFALAGVAAAVKLEAGVVTAARIAMGGVANTPLLAHEAAASLLGGPLSDQAIAIAASRATAGAEPLPQTAYKTALIEGLVRAALHEVRG